MGSLVINYHTTHKKYCAELQQDVNAGMNAKHCTHNQYGLFENYGESLQYRPGDKNQTQHPKRPKTVENK